MTRTHFELRRRAVAALLARHTSARAHHHGNDDSSREHAEPVPTAESSRDRIVHDRILLARHRRRFPQVKTTTAASRIENREKPAPHTADASPTPPDRDHHRAVRPA